MKHRVKIIHDDLKTLNLEEQINEFLSEQETLVASQNRAIKASLKGSIESGTKIPPFMFNKFELIDIKYRTHVETEYANTFDSAMVIYKVVESK